MIIPISLATATVVLASCGTTSDSVVSPPDQTTSSASAVSDESLVIIKGIDQTDTEAIEHEAATNADYRASAISYLEQVGVGPAAANTTDPLALTSADVETLLPKLKAMTGVEASPLAPDSNRAQPSPAVTSTGAPAAPSKLSFDPNPNTFPVQGSAQGNRSYWKGTPMVGIVRSVRNAKGEMEVTDRVTVNMTITPTRNKTVPGKSLGSKIAWNAVWSPNNRNLYQVHMDAWGINAGSIMYWSDPATSGDVVFPSRMSGTFYARNDRNLAGSVLTVAPDIWANSAQGWFAMGRKTNDCVARSAPDVTCIYP